jgi:cell division protein FtsZ
MTLTEYEEVLKIITASASDDALIIAGSSVSPSLADELRVTVIATGFASDDRPVATAAAVDADSEIISYEEWVSLNKGIGKRNSADFLKTRSASHAEPRTPARAGESEDLSVPTVLRERRNQEETS